MSAAKKAKPLSQQHRRFIAAYRELRNATRAYLRVYPRARPNTADSEGARLLSDPRISQEIERLDAEALRRNHMSADEVLSWTAQRARGDISECYWKPGELDGAGNVISADLVGTRKPIHLMPEHIRRCIKAIKHTDHGVDIIMIDPTPHELAIMKKHKLIDDSANITINVGFAERLRAAREKRLKDKK